MDEKSDKQTIDIQDESNLSEVSNENHQNSVHLQSTSQTMTLAKRKPPASTLAKAVVRRPIKLQNLVNNEVTVDTLYQKSVKQQPCSDAICYGALMKQSKDFFSTDSAANSTNKEKLFSEASDFFQQYFASSDKNGANSQAHLDRLKEVKAEIETNGTYLHRYDELIFGSKLAWRNAARCIGRIQWNKLQVFDARHCTTASELFEAICGHIKFATNNGNLRSAITIFPQRLHGREDYRVWNFQLISYAGYETEKSSEVDATKEGKSCPAVRGDPANVEFTKICQKLGWKGAGTNWDILPIVVSVPGEDPQVFSLPEEIILRVPLVHPKLDFFERLSLQWYALPAVANMKFEVGGIEFPACPFSGWYMDTEIAVRDLADRQRLNILPVIAKEMGLDTTSNASLWKDRAVLEVNTAVLYSFQQANVTIVDHYTASESFMTHLKNENRLRGGCPADWVWIVPPISGSLTPVFHQEMINYDLKPAFLYQEVPWKVHNWKGVNLLQNGRKDNQMKMSFQMTALVVQFMAGLYARALSTRPKCTILFATETGKSESFANRLGGLFSSAFNVSVLSMDAYEPISRLPKEQLLLIVTSTFGNGDPPENGEAFWKYLNALKSSCTVNGESAFSGSYAVFALGSNAYPHFCAFGRHLDDLLEALGGRRVTNCGTGDELAGQETSFQEWANGALKAACEQFQLKMPNADALPQLLKQAKWSPSSVRLEAVPQETLPEIEVDDANERSQRIVSTLGRLAHNKTIINWRLSAREYLGETKNALSALDQDPKTIKVVLHSADSTPIDYHPGDHLAIYPQNDPKTVSGIISRLSSGKANFDATQKLLVKTTVDGGQTWTIHDKLNRPVSLREALVRYLDICSAPTQHLLSLLADTEGLTEADKARLLQLATETEEYEQWKSEKSTSLLYLLEVECPSLVPPLELILTQLPTLQPRYYSISSSPLSLPNAVVLTVSVVRYQTADGALHNGVCSHFLHSIPAGRSVYGFIRAAPSFHLPKDPSVPMIWIGPGTGIAPFRSFWEHRHAMKKNLSKNVQLGTVKLFFGCRNAKTQLYRRDIVSMIAQGLIADYYVAFSRKTGKPKKYVQHVLQNKAVATEIAKMVLQQGGHIYVCGDVSMAADVEKVMAKILGHHEKVAGGDRIIEKLKESNRYHEDIFGVTKSAKAKELFENIVPVKEVAPLEFENVKEDNYIPITGVSYCRKRRLMVSKFWRPFW